MAKNIPASAKREAIKKVKKTLAKEGIKLKDIKLAKGKAPKKPLKVVNPLTGRKMAKDGPTFKKLIEEGYKFVPVKKANRELIAGVLMPPKTVIENVAKQNNIKPETLQAAVTSRVTNFASGIFGGAPATAPPNLRQMQNQRNELAEKPRLNEAERKEMVVLNRNINQMTQLNRAENQLVNVRPRNNQVREAINEVRETRNEVPVNQNKLQTVIGNAEQVVAKTNETVPAEKQPNIVKTKINAKPNLVNVRNNGVSVGKTNNVVTGTRNATGGAAPIASPIGVRPIGEKSVNGNKEAKNFDRTLGEALAKIVK
jgi:regulator of replication initiation timing